MNPRVLLLVGSFEQGGSERQAVQIATMLKQTGRYDVDLACLHPGGPLRNDAVAAGFSSIPSFPLTSFYDANAVGQLTHFVNLLKRRKVDVVQTFDFYTNIFGIAGASIARVKVRIAARRETIGVRTKAQRWLERRAFELAHLVAANSEAVREELIAEGVKPEKVITIYNGVDTNRIYRRTDVSRNELLASLQLPQDSERKFVTIVANMRHEMKDQATFLRAAQLVRSAVPDAAFILAGEGELLEQRRALAKELGLEQHAYFLNHCSAVGDLLTISDVCVLSSKGVEGFSNSILEYMAAACPVVATDVGGAREAIIEGETGLLVNACDHESLAKRIISLLRDPDLARRMGENGLLVARKRFSLEAQLRRIESLYAQLLLGINVEQLIGLDNKERGTRLHDALS
jgi:glycosyltransferase involved in cell wall biosynthesis